MKASELAALLLQHPDHHVMLQDGFCWNVRVEVVYEAEDGMTSPEQDEEYSEPLEVLRLDY